MILGYLNIEKDLLIELGKFYEMVELNGTNFPMVDCIFIDWIKGNPKNPNLEFAHQSVIVEKYTRKKIPIIYYDRYSSITRKEYDWLSKFNSYFFEPCIITRKGFAYLPQWTKILKSNEIKQNKNTYDLGYDGNVSNKYKHFEKYYKNYGLEYPQRKIIYNLNDTQKDIKDKLFKIGIIDEIFDWNDVLFTIIIDTKENYNKGYLDSKIFSVMSNGCIPLLPYEHKYFHAMFDYKIKDIEDIDYIINNTRIMDISDIIIEDIYKNIENLYPEFTLKYTLYKIRECLPE